MAKESTKRKGTAGTTDIRSDKEKALDVAIEENVRSSYGLLKDTTAGSADPGEEIRGTESDDTVPAEQTMEADS